MGRILRPTSKSGPF